jgi:hypothetical protein
MAELRNWVVNSARLYGCLEAEEPQRVVRLEQTPQNLLFVVENLVSLFHQHVQFWHHYWTAGQANSQASLPIIGTGIMFDAPMDRADRAGLVISYSVNIQELRRLFDPSSDFTNQLDTIKRVEVRVALADCWTRHSPVLTAPPPPPLLSRSLSVSLSRSCRRNPRASSTKSRSS